MATVLLAQGENSILWIRSVASGTAWCLGVHSALQLLIWVKGSQREPSEAKGYSSPGPLFHCPDDVWRNNPPEGDTFTNSGTLLLILKLGQQQF